MQRQAAVPVRKQSHAASWSASERSQQYCISSHGVLGRDAGYDERLLAYVTIKALLLLHRTEQAILRSKRLEVDSCGI